MKDENQLENRVAVLEQWIDTIKANWLSKQSVEILIETNDNNIFGQIEGIQQLIVHAQEGIEKCFERIERLELDHLDKLSPYAYVTLNTKLQELETEINTVRALGSRAFHPSRPHKCPVCDGRGKLWPQGTIGYDRCEPCEGKGVLWG